MKEINLKLVDKIADYISKDAEEMGLTSEELLKYVVGSYVQESKRKGIPTLEEMSALPLSLGSAMTKALGSLDNLRKEYLKQQAREGALSCKNCTMKLTEQNVDDNKCGSCGASIREIPKEDSL